AAENGHAWSQRQLAYCYQFGHGVAQNYQKAFEWYNKAAEQGHAQAQGDIGFFYEKGYHVAQNYGKALEWYKKAAENGHAWSQRQLAYCYQFGNGVAQNYQKAFEWYNKAAEQGHAQAQGDVGFFYEKGYHVTQNYEKAFEWYKKAAENGNAWSQCKLGYCYGNGKGVEMSNEKAFEWYTKSALQNDVTAQYNLALYYENGYGTAQNYQKAIEWYEKAKSGGDTDAQAAIDRIKAKLAQQTEEKKAKEAEAQFDLGEKYYYGRGGFVTNYTQAANHYRKAAENGHVKAQVEIGRCYENGRGVLKDPALAVSWITKAAEKGNADAQASLGYYYDTGFGVVQNYYKAVEWYTKAALQNNKTAQYNLAICYEYGRGVIADKYKAIEWYNKAAAQGHAKARDAAARLSAHQPKSAPAATAATYEKKPGFFARSFFFMFSLVALIPLLFVFDNGKVWAALYSITPLGLAKQTGIPNFSYSMTVFTVCTVIVYLISLLFIKYILHEHDKVPFNNHLLNVIACIGIWYAGYGISHLLVKITWGYRFFALIIAIVASFALAIAHFFLQSALDINLHYSKDVTSYNNKLCLVNLKYIVSLAFFHIGMTIVLAYENGIGHEDTFWNNFTLTALLIGGAVFSLFYAIKRITVVCEKGMMSYRKREKIRNEIIFIVITLAAAAALFFFLGVPGINVENKALEICLFPALITIPFVLIFRIISIISIKARN
ncbi:MAG: SEL1-like repeat protein, partial [Clostridia bacterium]|nr:SEL1-like repeat protein [Clostridia bacterium]